MGTTARAELLHHSRGRGGHATHSHCKWSDAPPLVHTALSHAIQLRAFPHSQLHVAAITPPTREQGGMHGQGQGPGTVTLVHHKAGVGAGG
jgi:hypothetical protein